MKTYRYILALLLALVIVVVFVLFTRLKEKDKNLNLNIKPTKKTLKLENQKNIAVKFEPLQRDEVFEIIKNEDKTKIQLLKNKFNESELDVHKSLYAALLINLGVNDDKYFEYLKNQADKIIVDDRPYPFARDEAGRRIRGEYTEEFKEWCNKNNKEIKTCLSEWGHFYPATMRYLGLSKDKKFFEYLSAGLNNSNDAMVIASAAGFGMLGDKKAVPLIEESLKNAEGNVLRSYIAQSLFYIDDPYAHELAKNYMLKESQSEIHIKKSKEKNYKYLLLIY